MNSEGWLTLGATNEGQFGATSSEGGGSSWRGGSPGRQPGSRPGSRPSSCPPSRAVSSLSGFSQGGLSDAGTENTYMRQFKPTFANYSQYIFSVLAAVISAKEIWRFPYTILGHDSGIFTLLYIIFTLSIGIPIVYLEIVIGTRFKLGVLKSFYRMDARASGVGLSHLLFSFVLLLYQPMVMVWALFYIWMSISWTLPWNTCLPVGSVLSECCIEDSSTYHWFQNVLNVSTGLRDTRPTHQTHLVLCYLLSWFLTFLCLLRGLRLGAYISYFTVTIPLIILPVLFFGVLSLKGAPAGLQAFLSPNPGSIVKVSFPFLLLDTVGQILNTCGVVIGVLMTFKSRSRNIGYPTFEALLIGFTNMLISLFSGLILYAIIGHHMLVRRRPKEEMFTSRGASIVFTAFADIFSHLFLPNLWSFLFYLSLLLITLDSVYGQVNAITLSLMEVGGFGYIPYTTLVLIVILLSALGGLPFIMGNGIYLFEQFDVTSSLLITILALIEVVYVSWFYGIDRLDSELKMKTGLKMNDVWKFLLKWFIPFALLGILIAWSMATIIELPNYMRFVGCQQEGYKGMAGTTTWFKKTYLGVPELLIKLLSIVFITLPIPFFIWYFWHVQAARGEGESVSRPGSRAATSRPASAAAGKPPSRPPSAAGGGPSSRPPSTGPSSRSPSRATERRGSEPRRSDYERFD